MKSSTTFSFQQPKPPRRLVSLCLVVLTSAAWTTHAGPPTSASPGTPASDLQRWYDRAVDDCGDPRNPAYQCSGILLRATDTTPSSVPWEPSDRQLAKGSVSFSWVRGDVGFARPFSRGNGFILYPNQDVPTGKASDMHIRCSFPLNASTNSRDTLQGCGPLPGHALTTDTCQNLGITTAAQWLQRYADGAESQTCGWYLEGVDSLRAAPAFKAAADAHQGLDAKRWATNNEVLVAVWPKGSGGTLPLHSFFHIAGDRRELVKAQRDQIRYHQQYGRFIPVVSLGFPESKGERMSFGYDQRDQAVGQPVRTPFVDFEEVPVGVRERVVSNGVEFLLGHERNAVSDRPHPASGGLIRNRHLSVDSTLRFTAEGAGRRRLTFSWGCNRACAVGRAIAGTHVSLLENEDGAMHYGTHEVIVDGPEAFLMVIDGDDAGTEMVLDNLDMQEVAAGIDPRR